MNTASKYLIALILFGITITFHNDSDSKAYYLLYWIDSPYSVFPVNMAGGELDSKETNPIDINYTPGLYFIIWSNEDGESLFRDRKQLIDNSAYIFKPSGIEVKRGI